MAYSSMVSRIEKDSLGEVEIPISKYYGITTQRALNIFKISGFLMHPKFLKAYIILKKSCALTNMKLGLLKKEFAEAIVEASDEILQGKLRDQFEVDVFQMGAGTSFNMNCNEVISNRANEILGFERGKYEPINPNDHVNMSQSTNDTFPTAIRISILDMLLGLDSELVLFVESLGNKGHEFDGIIKSGRTHLNDAVPIRLGQEFSAYSKTISKCRNSLQRTKSDCRKIGIGGTAVGTGLNIKSEYIQGVIDELNRFTSLDLIPAEDMREVMQSQNVVAEVSSALRNLALELIRISNDLRLLASGPKTGLSEISLPSLISGSSIMPGKVNPSLLEMLNMVCFQVLGNDHTIAMAVQAGQLELNVMMPVMAFNILFSIEILTNAIRQTRIYCIKGIEADEERCKYYSEVSLSLATILNPIIGFHKAAELVKSALNVNKTLVEVIREKKILSDEEIKKILDPKQMTEPILENKKED
jgi:aspartate ammonia-lyase